MDRSTKVDYAAVNARGVTLHTFSDAAAGRAWVRANAPLHDGLHLRKVTITTTSDRIYSVPASVRRAADLRIPRGAEPALCG